MNARTAELVRRVLEAHRRRASSEPYRRTYVNEVEEAIARVADRQ